MNTTQDPKLVNQYTKSFLNNKHFYHQTPHKNVDIMYQSHKFYDSPFYWENLALWRTSYKNGTPVLSMLEMPHSQPNRVILGWREFDDMNVIILVLLWDFEPGQYV